MSLGRFRGVPPREPVTGQHFPKAGLNTSTKIVKPVTVYSTGKLTYLLDGQSLALFSNTPLIIWGIQMGEWSKNLKVATQMMFLQCGHWMGEQLAASIRSGTLTLDTLVASAHRSPPARSGQGANHTCSGPITCLFGS